MTLPFATRRELNASLVQAPLMSVVLRVFGLLTRDLTRNVSVRHTLDPDQQSFRDGVILVLSTGYSMGCAAAIILNAIIPAEAAETELPTAPAAESKPVDAERLESADEAKA